MTREFILRRDSASPKAIVEAALNLARAIFRDGMDVCIAVSPWQSTRSREQNALMWALLTDLSEQKQWPVDGRLCHLSPEEWKDVMTAGLTKHQRVAAGIDGGFVLLGRSTRRMKVSEMSELCELIQAFGAEHGVRFREPTEARQAA